MTLPLASVAFLFSQQNSTDLARNKGKLKYLNMTFSKKLKRLPDFFGVPNLEKLILKGCEGLTESCFDEFRRLHKS
ncbi:hypothetical protein MTR_7g078650 [Medicago truncatula]|uniref:Uncharacterized protein n=1 Tax=Medicago truncatula TaxID=3880 RepID=G7L6K7_MEDTR|nr:hypothetical protein MTR_7g078650 [Medicago truncatula]